MGTESLLLKSRGGLFVLIERDEPTMSTVYLLTCATHYVDRATRWAIPWRVNDEELEPLTRIDRPLFLSRIIDRLTREARHSLKTCSCVSPLFDADYTS